MTFSKRFSKECNDCGWSKGQADCPLTGRKNIKDRAACSFHQSAVDHQKLLPAQTAWAAIHTDLKTGMEFNDIRDLPRCVSTNEALRVIGGWDRISDTLQSHTILLGYEFINAWCAKAGA